MILLPLLFQAAECPALPGGPAEGMCLALAPDQIHGRQLVPLLPAAKPGRPIPAETATLIAKAIAAYHAEQPIPRELRTENATLFFCAEYGAGCFTPAPMAGWAMPRGLDHNAPYLLANGKIRVEWMRDGKLAYLSILTLRGDRIDAIGTTPAAIPFQAR